MAKFPREARPIKLAWALEYLAGTSGFSFAGDAHLAKETGIPLSKVNGGLLELERAGAIVRVTVPTGKHGAFERRIFLSWAIIGEAPQYPVTGYPPLPRHGQKPYPVTGDQNNKEGRRPSESFTSRAARMEAERRERKASGNPVSIFDDG
ncbi:MULTISPECIES: hypothetical protein [unclassified Chelatococcus]|uniref:hypothetical protein n=1 Tax=unclassified Chelatococcus TaxID=2638111 RepID=UPI001BCDE5EF|nr:MULTISPECIES: hypothetical protein [unclassified Chelatococcus]MBS7738962.1 hypothetical protein [Chelatococcus sp. HY11]MBX3543395.1 hypothetical protein [Chelatococcus sp.]MCO5076508.1 hypothetical protein [Chelatococcus sp.]